MKYHNLRKKSTCLNRAKFRNLTTAKFKSTCGKDNHAVIYTAIRLRKRGRLSSSQVQPVSVALEERRISQKPQTTRALLVPHSQRHHGRRHFVLWSLLIVPKHVCKLVHKIATLVCIFRINVALRGKNVSSFVDTLNNAATGQFCTMNTLTRLLHNLSRKAGVLTTHMALSSLHCPERYYRRMQHCYLAKSDKQRSGFEKGKRR